MHGRELEHAQGLVEIRHPAAAELVGELGPGTIAGGPDLTPVEEDVAGVGVELEPQSLVGERARGLQILKAREGVAVPHVRAVIGGEAEGLPE